MAKDLHVRLNMMQKKEERFDYIALLKKHYIFETYIFAITVKPKSF